MIASENIRACARASPLKYNKAPGFVGRTLCCYYMFATIYGTDGNAIGVALDPSGWKMNRKLPPLTTPILNPT
jgi:hypothetical protein